MAQEQLHVVRARWSVENGDKPLPQSAVYDSILRVTHSAMLNHSLSRGMDFLTDAVDWIGGYPMEWVLASDLCIALRHKGLFPIRGPYINSGMTTVLAVSRDSDDAMKMRAALGEVSGQL